MNEIDTTNAQLVGRQADHVVVTIPRNRMTRREALVHAAWLILVADDDGEFPQVLEAVQGGDLRDQRIAAIHASVGRGLAWNFDAVVPLLLDDLDAIGDDHPAGPAALAEAVDAALAHERELMARGDLSAGPGTPPDAWMTAWTEAHPAEFAAWARKQQRIQGSAPADRILGDAPESVPPLTAMPPTARESQQAAKPAPRRRTTTTRKAAGS